MVNTRHCLAIFIRYLVKDTHSSFHPVFPGSWSYHCVPFSLCQVLREEEKKLEVTVWHNDGSDQSQCSVQRPGSDRDEIFNLWWDYFSIFVLSVSGLAIDRDYFSIFALWRLCRVAVLKIIIISPEKACTVHVHVLCIGMWNWGGVFILNCQVHY